MKSVYATAALAAGALARDAPTRVQARAATTSICGQWDSVETGIYTVYQDLWNEDAGTGSQCTTVDSVTDNTLVWSTEWSWSGGSSDVKSFANAVTNFTITTLSAIGSIDSTWQWSYTGSDIVADVAYDMFTSSTASGSDEYEIMVWLAALGGAGPISSTGSSVATPTINDVSWELYDGYNGDMHVFSFVAATNQTDFSGDMMDFFTYLIDNEGMSSSQYLLSIGAGSEPFTGSDAVFSVSAYSCSVSTGSSSGSTATAAAATTSAAATSSTSVAVAAATSSSAAAVTTQASTSAAEVTSHTTIKSQATTFATSKKTGATGTGAAVYSTSKAVGSGVYTQRTSAAATSAATSASSVSHVTSTVSVSQSTSAAAVTTSKASSTKSSCGPKAKRTVTVFA